MTFNLDPRLEADTHAVIDLGLCTVRLMNDTRFPWLILVPRIADLVETTDLGQNDRYQLMDEIATSSAVLQRLFPDTHKMNVAALGNMVRQLHVHVIARRATDAAWPNPVWGIGNPEPYEAEAMNKLLTTIRVAFQQTQ